jgi:hypothetical protein
MADVPVTEDWFVKKTYEKDGRIIVAEWECQRTTNGYMLPYAGETVIDLPIGAAIDDIVQAVISSVGPSQIEQMRNSCSEHALYMQMKEQATVVDHTL